jgi:hypothetical protein
LLSIQTLTFIRVLEKLECRTCKQKQLGIFFDSEEFKQHHWYSPGDYEMLCLGCKLTMHLGYEADHDKRAKHDMVKRWLGNPNEPIKMGDLDKAPDDGRKRIGRRAAKIYEDRRKRREESDPEPEKQQPKVRGRKYSPNIYDVEQHDYW